MAIDYTELFTDIGKNVFAVNQFHDSARSLGLSLPNYDTLLASIQTRYESQDLRQLISNLESTYDSYRDTSSSWAAQQSDRVQQRFLDRVSVVNQLAGADVGDIDRTIREIFRDMLGQGQTLNQSTVVVGTATIEGNSNGGITTTTLLDGVTPPSPGFGSFLLYKGERSALAVTSETMTLTCIADEDTDGTPEGQEVFLWEGQPATNGTFGWKTEGSGISVQLSTVQAAETLANRDLEAWDDANNPSNWTIEAGVAGTDIIQETAAINVHRGTSALRLVGNGFDIRLIQELPSSAGSFLVPNQRLFYMTFIKAENVTSGTLTIRMESTSGEYDPTINGEEIVLDAAALGLLGVYSFRAFFLSLDATLPEDLRWVIRYEGSPDGTVWIDSMGLSPLTYANGIGLAVSAGSEQFVRNDRFTFSVDNTEGLFQQFLRRRFQFQLPQSFSPTIPDSLIS